MDKTGESLMPAATKLQHATPLFLQLEGILNTGQFGREGLVHFQALFDGRAAVDDCRMIAVADELSDA